MGLKGPSREVVYEPVEVPAGPREEPEREPAPSPPPRREREPVPA